MKEAQRAVIKTLLYAYIWKVGLTVENIWCGLISEKRIMKSDFEKVLQSGVVDKKGNLFFLKNKKYTNPISSQESFRKLTKAKKIVEKLSRVPSILMIGVSGSTAHMTARAKDDIDLFVIVENNTLWISRMILVIFLELLGVRRRKLSSKIKDTICLNMIIERNSMVFGKQRRDVYTAYEIVRLIPLFQRDRIYEKFLQKNRWVSDFLINASADKKSSNILSKKNSVIPTRTLSFFNNFAKVFQLWYMKPYTKKEIVSDTLLAFHPFDYRVHILREYDRKLKEYEFD